MDTQTQQQQMAHRSQRTPHTINPNPSPCTTMNASIYSAQPYRQTPIRSAKIFQQDSTGSYKSSRVSHKMPNSYMSQPSHHQHAYSRQRTVQSHFAASSSPAKDGSIIQGDQDWRRWPEVTVIARGLADFVVTLDLYNLVCSEGNVSRIDIRNKRYGERFREAYIVFSPPPSSSAMWASPNRWFFTSPTDKTRHPVSFSLQGRKRDFLQESPAGKGKKFPEKPGLNLRAVGFGVMVEENKMMEMFTAMKQSNEGMNFVLDLLKAKIVVTFPLRFGAANRDSINDKTAEGHRIEAYKFTLLLNQMKQIWEIDIDTSTKALIFSLDIPPLYYSKTTEVGATHDDGNHWDEGRTWFRRTDVVSDRKMLKPQPIKFEKEKPIIDIGRWTTFKIVFKMDSDNSAWYTHICNALQDWNVQVKRPSKFSIVPRVSPKIWTTLGDIKKDFKLVTEAIHLSYAIRYQLEVCISQDIFIEQNVTRAFLEKLVNMDETEALSRLESIAQQRKRYYNPMEIFEAPLVPNSRKMTGPKWVLSRLVTITPSGMIYNSPTIGLSNRVYREYPQYSENFLRVRFTDEAAEGKLYSNPDHTNDDLFHRVHRCLEYGIQIGNKHFEYLGSGNSQFREHGAYFFCRAGNISAADIRNWIGDLREMPTIAKFTSRLGQGFSTTRAYTASSVKIKEMLDVERNGYNFTDGVGKISKFLAQSIAIELGLPSGDNNFPSLFQFRLGGCKGILVASSGVGPLDIHIRRSQYKFAASHEKLEIIRSSAFSGATLNRQIIIVLRALKIQEEAFQRLQKTNLRDLELAMADTNKATKLLSSQVDANQTTLKIADMISNGFMSANEPFVMTLLHLWRAWRVKKIKEKAAIAVEDSALVFGCTDETQTLKGYYEHHESSSKYSKTRKELISNLPEIFFQYSNARKNGQSTILTGVCIVARNPSLHPGDIRVVNAVDIAALHHLRDVVVFAQTGDRDVPNMCSGGDLDGDDFIVIWDKDLIPRPECWFELPMNFQGPKPQHLGRDIKVDDVISFFVHHMKYENLGRIAHAHLANADFYAEGARSKKCLELAELHSIAVDFPKTGIPAILQRSHLPPKYPHFMESKHRSKDRIYHSTSVLGKLFDSVSRIDFEPLLNVPFDLRIINAYEIDKEQLILAAELKTTYDCAILRVMKQHSINTEFEIWSTFIIEHAGLHSDYKMQEEMGNIMIALKERFQNECFEKAGGKDSTHLHPFVAAMYTVTANEVTLWRKRVRSVGNTSGAESLPKSGDMPLISFPWLFQTELGKIANMAKDALPHDPQTGVVLSSSGEVKAVDEKGLLTLVGAVETRKDLGARVNIAGISEDQRRVLEVDDGVREPCNIHEQEKQIEEKPNDGTAIGSNANATAFTTRGSMYAQRGVITKVPSKRESSCCDGRPTSSSSEDNQDNQGDEQDSVYSQDTDSTASNLVLRSSSDVNCVLECGLTNLTLDHIRNNEELGTESENTQIQNGGCKAADHITPRDLVQDKASSIDRLSSDELSEHRHNHHAVEQLENEKTDALIDTGNDGFLNATPSPLSQTESNPAYGAASDLAGLDVGSINLVGNSQELLPAVMTSSLEIENSSPLSKSELAGLDFEFRDTNEMHSMAQGKNGDDINEELLDSFEALRDPNESDAGLDLWPYESSSHNDQLQTGINPTITTGVQDLEDQITTKCSRSTNDSREVEPGAAIHPESLASPASDSRQGLEEPKDIEMDPSPRDNAGCLE